MRIIKLIIGLVIALFSFLVIMGYMADYPFLGFSMILWVLLAVGIIFTLTSYTSFALGLAFMQVDKTAKFNTIVGIIAVVLTLILAFLPNLFSFIGIDLGTWALMILGIYIAVGGLLGSSGKQALQPAVA